MRRISGRAAIRILTKQGFVIRNQRGSHVQLAGYIKGCRRLVTIPVHSNKKMPIGTLLIIIQQAGFSKKEFERLL